MLLRGIRSDDVTLMERMYLVFTHMPSSIITVLFSLREKRRVGERVKA